MTTGYGGDIFLFFKMIGRFLGGSMMVGKTVVVGGGAAGLMAAISAAGAGEKVDLLEGNPRLGRKILISGNGRCNLTNLDADAFRHYHGGYPGFV